MNNGECSNHKIHFTRMERRLFSGTEFAFVGKHIQLMMVEQTTHMQNI